MNLDIKELQIKLNKKYNTNEPGIEYFGGRVPSDPYLVYRQIQSVFMSKERAAIRYVNDLSKYIHKTSIKTGVQDCVFNKELVEKVSKLLSVFPEFLSREFNDKDFNAKDFLERFSVDVNDTASKIGLTIVLTLWFLMPFIGLPALVPLVGLWSDKKDILDKDNLNTGIDILIEFLYNAYNKAFDKNISYNPKNFKNDSKTITVAFNKLLTDKNLIDASKAKKSYKLDTSEKLLLINTIRRDIEPFKAFVGSKPSKNIDIAKKLSKLLNIDSIDELGEEFISKVAWCIDIIGLLDKLQDILYDCIINLSKDVFLIMA